MHITNTHRGPLGLPTGQELQPNVATPVHDWATIKKNVVVQGWLKAGILVEGAAVEEPAADAPDRDELIAKLAALGVKHHPNTGVPKLQALLAEVEAKAQEDRESFFEATRIQERAVKDSGLTLDEWQELSDAEKEAQSLAAAEKLRAEAQD